MQTDRDKLIELIINADTYDSCECKLCTKDDDACDCCHAEKLADHLLSNGVIVLDMNVISTKNRPLITHFAGMPLNDVFDLVRAKEEGRLIVPPCKVGGCGV